MMAFFWVRVSCQTITMDASRIDNAVKALKAPMEEFDSCVPTAPVESCVSTLVKSCDTDYKKFIAGNIVYTISKPWSYRLHKQAYNSNPGELAFLFEYAMELHRNGEYAQAIPLYEKYRINSPDDYRACVWLADCYLNTGNARKSVENWNLASHQKNHSGIDFAIHSIYGDTTVARRRSDLREAAKGGNQQSLNSLIFMDLNWQSDWWNAAINEKLLQPDLALAEQVLGKDSREFNVLQTYVNVKKQADGAKSSQSIKSLLTKSSLLVGTEPLPHDGQMTSDLIRIALINHVVNEKELYEQRGEELLQLAHKLKDAEFLNTYAHLQSTVEGKVNPEIDKLGWKEFKDERFALSYFVGNADKNRYDDPELQQALIDFPNSSKLYWIKTSSAKAENKPLQPHWIELIRREFKTLGSDPNHYSYRLKSYFVYLQNEL
jgi:hypothetical protein